MFKNLRDRLKAFTEEAAGRLSGKGDEDKEATDAEKGTAEGDRTGVKKKEKGEERTKVPSKAKANAAAPPLADTKTTQVEPIPYKMPIPPEPVRKEKDAGKEGVKVEKVKRSDREKDVFTDGILGFSISGEKLDAILGDLEIILLESDVAFPVVQKIKKVVKKDLEGRKVKIGLNIGEVIEDSLRRAVRKVLLTDEPINFDEYIQKAEKPAVLMFVGINGTGKTTAIARVAHRLLRNGHSCVIAAGDTFRAGAIEQLEKHAENLRVRLVKHQAGSDPAAVAFDAIEHAKARKKDVVLLDTAGRMQTNINLMDEMKKIKRVAEPDMIIFVGDALAGNDAVAQAKAFDEAVGIDAAILTKIDADAKGGAALSIAYAVGKPILFVGTGQNYEDLVRFNSKWMVNRLFGPKDSESAEA